jgi:4-amino-4-deoxy-L-arabinose transferase-like glycosyltransferase
MKREPSPIVIILAVATLLRIAALSQMLWADEAYTAMLARMPLGQMAAATACDVHPPTWYLIEIAFVRLFGMSEATLRLPSAVLGVLAVWLTYRLARALFDERVALVATGLMAINPFAVYYSQEARMYALLMTAVLLACLGAAERRAWLLALGVALTLMSHNLGVIYIPFIALATRKSDWRKNSVAMIAGVIPWLAWLPQLFRQATSGQFSGSYWISYFTGNSVARLLAEWVQLWFPHFRPEWMARIGALITFSLLVFPLIEVVRRRAGAAAVLAMLVVGPGLLELAISAAWQPIILVRTLAGCVPAWCALVAWWVTLPRRWNVPRVALIGTAASAIIITTLSLYSFERSPNMKTLIAWLNLNSQPSDLICHTSGSTQVFFDFYFPGRSTSETDQCTWLLDERYILTDPDTSLRADELLVEQHGELALQVQKNPAITTNLYRLNPSQNQ